MPSQPAAFLSYVRFNDQHDDGWVSQFCERLSAEVRVQLGEEFPIFQDRKDIVWGQSWQRRIDQALDAVTLLLVIITPGFFRSAACRAEVERFLARERDLGRDDLILPVYYVSTPELDDPQRRDADELARVLGSRQFADWRDLRFEPLTSPGARRAVAHLATRMRDTFWRSSANLPTGPRKGASSATEQSQSTKDASAVRRNPNADSRAHMADAPAVIPDEAPAVIEDQAKAGKDNARPPKQAREDNLSNGRKLELICRAFASVFSYSELEQFLRFRFDRRLNQISTDGVSLRDVCFRVVDASYSEGWLEDLVREAVSYKPFSRTLKDMATVVGMDD